MSLSREYYCHNFRVWWIHTLYCYALEAFYSDDRIYFITNIWLQRWSRSTQLNSHLQFCTHSILLLLLLPITDILHNTTVLRKPLLFRKRFTIRIFEFYKTPASFSADSLYTVYMEPMCLYPIQMINIRIYKQKTVLILKIFLL